MDCIKCGSETSVYDSRKRKNGEKLRRRKCGLCGYKFKSTESYVIKYSEAPDVFIYLDHILSENPIKRINAYTFLKKYIKDIEDQLLKI